MFGYLVSKPLIFRKEKARDHETASKYRLDASWKRKNKKTSIESRFKIIKDTEIAENDIKKEKLGDFGAYTLQSVCIGDLIILFKYVSIVCTETLDDFVSLTLSCSFLNIAS